MKNVLNTSTSTENSLSSITEIYMINSSSSVDDTSSSNEENDDYSLFFPLMKYLITGRKRHRIEHYLDV